MLLKILIICIFYNFSLLEYIFQVTVSLKKKWSFLKKFLDTGNKDYKQSSFVELIVSWCQSGACCIQLYLML